MLDMRRAATAAQLEVDDAAAVTDRDMNFTDRDRDADHRLDRPRVAMPSLARVSGVGGAGLAAPPMMSPSESVSAMRRSQSKYHHHQLQSIGNLPEDRNPIAALSATFREPDIGVERFFAWLRLLADAGACVSLLTDAYRDATGTRHVCTGQHAVVLRNLEPAAAWAARRVLSLATALPVPHYAVLPLPPIALEQAMMASVAAAGQSTLRMSATLGPSTAAAAIRDAKRPSFVYASVFLNYSGMR